MRNRFSKDNSQPCATCRNHVELYREPHDETASGDSSQAPHLFGASMDFTKQTYCNQVTSYIRSLIRKGTLEIGAPVKEAVLSEQLGISRAPIREALQVLVQEGLITSEPQKGKHVRQMTGKEIYDSYVVAGILEGAGVAESLPLLDRGEHGNLPSRRPADGKGEISYATKLDELAEIDELFHATLFMACDNTRLVEMARTSCATISKYLCYQHWITMFTPREYADRHHAVAEAVYSRDVKHVETALRDHYKETGLRMAQFGKEA